MMTKFSLTYQSYTSTQCDRVEEMKTPPAFRFACISSWSLLIFLLYVILFSNITRICYLLDGIDFIDVFFLNADVDAVFWAFYGAGY